ncbi:hypothetical protein QQ020_21685 [Fulvivirgaceae bacterium BMA12]|uniref:Uncharacterized protein n=1 Tax=Agaribacillus aureus TaxID=3051825 RepID=A0ABT8LAC1_9BACT|nr:hypothetical protein [Fulvivirgaceae bacterium BMA12]
MQQIDIKSIRKLRFPAGNILQIGAVYKGVERAFAKDNLFTLFAVPVLLPDNEIEWKTPLSGTITRFDLLNTNEQTELERILIDQVQQIMDLAENDAQLQEKIKKWIEIPRKEEDIYRVDQRAVLTRWGFIDETAVKGKGEISYLLKTKKYLLYIQARYEDHSPVPNIEIAYTYKGRSESIITDDEGNGIISGIAEGESLEVSATHNDEEQSKGFKVFEDTSCKLIFPKKQDMRFQVHYADSEEVAANEKFTVNYLEDVCETISDQEGRFQLKNVKVGLLISIVHSKNWKLNPDEVTCESTKQEYSISLTIPPPIVFKKKIRIYYELTNEPLQGAKVLVKIGEKKEEHISDEEGFITLQSENEPLSENILLDIKAKKPSGGRISFFHQFFRKKK